jgi:hypothetical protein
VLSGHNLSKSSITVNRINADGTLGSAVHQPNTLDYGAYPHQEEHQAAPARRHDPRPSKWPFRLYGEPRGLEC